MKKSIKVFLALALVLSALTACDEPSTAASQSPEPSTTTTQTAEKLSFTLVAGEKGEYGEWFTINKDTEFEENYYVYRVPAGTYTVTNAGKYMDQFNVYGDKVYTTDAGREELSDVIYVKLFKQGESDTVTIEDGQIIKISGNGTWELVRN